MSTAKNGGITEAANKVAQALEGATAGKTNVNKVPINPHTTTKPRVDAIVENPQGILYQYKPQASQATNLPSYKVTHANEIKVGNISNGGQKVSNPNQITYNFDAKVQGHSVASNATQAGRSITVAESQRFGVGAAGLVRDSVGVPMAPNAGGKANIAQLEKLHQDLEVRTMQSIFNEDGFLTQSAIDEEVLLKKAKDCARNNFNISADLNSTPAQPHFYLYRKTLSSKSLNELAKPVDPLLIDKIRSKGWTIDIAKKAVMIINI